MLGTVKIGLIGYGYWGPNLLRNLNSLSDVEVLAVADQSEGQLARVHASYPNIKTVTDFHDFYDMGIQAVAIATPPATHYAIGLDCLQNGVSVMIEKPLTLKATHSEELIRVANENNLTLMVGHTFEYNPAIRMIKHMIQAGELGDILYIDAARLSMGKFQDKANVIWDLAPHDISILLYILNEEPHSVSVAAVDSITDGLVDLAYMSLRFPSGIHGHIQVSWLSPRKVRQITVVGTKKMLIMDDVEPIEKIKVYDKSVTDSTPYTETFAQFNWSYQHGDVLIPHIKFDEPLRLETQEFIDCVKTNRTPLTDGENGLRVVKILEATDESIQQGGQVITITDSNLG